MKIPETQANIGAYYGNEENGQWQPNGVIIDSGVGGGIVGSGDAGVHRPPVYPVHIPRGHIPGYVMAGAFYPPAYPPAAPPDDFEDYMWMENEEEFDKQVMQQLEEEALMEQCIEAMLEDEQRERRQRPVSNGHSYPTTSNGGPSLSLEEAVSRSTLNPLAAEFVPSRGRQCSAEEKVEPSETRTEPTETKEESQTQVTSELVSDPVRNTEESKTEEVIPTPTEPPEVSAADIQPIDPKKTAKDTKKDTKVKEIKKTPKPEVKAKTKPLVVKSETKVQPKKKEVKVVKSEVRVEEREEVSPPVEVVKLPSPPLPLSEDSSTQSITKPINYAAAAKANKPKKPIIAPVIEKAPPKPIEKIEKKDRVVKDRLKTEKPIAKVDRTIPLQRKNSVK